jgi:hypothetical protein
LDTACEFFREDRETTHFIKEQITKLLIHSASKPAFFTLKTLTRVTNMQAVLDRLS